jgi:predicted GIY-YIG superfamily endonuclease
MNKIYIYELTCPLTLIPKYIGKSINPEKRLKQHLKIIKNKQKLTKKRGILN